MFNIEKAHFIIDEMVLNGLIVETNKANILNPVVAVVKSAGQWRWLRRHEINVFWQEFETSINAWKQSITLLKLK